MQSSVPASPSRRKGRKGSRRDRTSAVRRRTSVPHRAHVDRSYRYASRGGARASLVRDRPVPLSRGGPIHRSENASSAFPQYHGRMNCPLRRGAFGPRRVGNVLRGAKWNRRFTSSTYVLPQPLVHCADGRVSCAGSGTDQHDRTAYGTQHDHRDNFDRGDRGSACACSGTSDVICRTHAKGNASERVLIDQQVDTNHHRPAA